MNEVQMMNEEKSDTPRPRILVADDEESMRVFVERSLSRRGYKVEAVASGEAAIERCEERRFDAAVVDLKMPGTDGIEVLTRVREQDPEALVIIMTAYGTVSSAVDAMKRGAHDYITKPFEIDELLLLLERALGQRAALRENRELRRLVDNRRAYGGLIGQSPAMRAVFQNIDLLRESSSTVLITGESGTGKELLARAIHMNSGRAQGPFIGLNCTALPDNLFESELFGFAAGAFTGAQKGKQGLMMLADGGTLFLDEIAEISDKAQVKLLRFLQERTFRPLGTTETLSVDLRIITATNRHLEKRVEDGAFRQDLYWRLNVVPIHLPPLRERREDIPVLASHFIERQMEKGAAASKGLSVDAMIVLSCYPWPGNVRELENTIERMIVLHPGKELLDVEDVPEEIRNKAAGGEGLRAPGDTLVFKDAQSTFEREYFSGLFKRTRGNISQAAQLSGISRSQLHYKIKKLGFDPSRYRE